VGQKNVASLGISVSRGTQEQLVSALSGGNRMSVTLVGECGSKDLRFRRRWGSGVYSAPQNSKEAYRDRFRLSAPQTREQPGESKRNHQGTISSEEEPRRGKVRLFKEKDFRFFGGNTRTLLTVYSGGEMSQGRQSQKTLRGRLRRPHYWYGPCYPSCLLIAAVLRARADVNKGQGARR